MVWALAAHGSIFSLPRFVYASFIATNTWGSNPLINILVVISQPNRTKLIECSSAHITPIHQALHRKMKQVKKMCVCALNVLLSHLINLPTKKSPHVQHTWSGFRLVGQATELNDSIKEMHTFLLQHFHDYIDLHHSLPSQVKVSTSAQLVFMPPLTVSSMEERRNYGVN